MVAGAGLIPRCGGHFWPFSASDRMLEPTRAVSPDNDRIDLDAGTRIGAEI